LLAQARALVNAVAVLGWCLMPNHWHLVLLPRRGADDALSTFMGWLSNAHVRRWHAHQHSFGRGHVYLGRFKSFPVKTVGHLLTVLRYVASNAIRSAARRRPLAQGAQDWRWSSFGMRYGDRST
jgi:putative transposase